MEIKDYYLILKRNIYLIVIITALFAVISFLMTMNSKPNYQSSVAIEIDRIPAQAQKDVDFYQFENYYTQQVSAALSSNMSDWLTSASAVSKIFETAGYPLPSGDVRDLGKTFTVRKKQESSSVLDISYSSKDREQAEKIISAAASVTKDKINEYNTTDISAKFLTRSDTPVVIETPKQTTINTLIAAFLGLVISLGLVSVREALK